MVKGLGHAGISTRNMDESIRFYCDILGGRIILEVEEPKGTPWIKCVQYPDNTCIELFYPRKDFPLGTELGRNHSCFIVEDILELFQKLKESEIPITTEPRVARDGNLQMWCLDPNGYPVEFLQLTDTCPQVLHGPKVILS